MAAVFFKVKKTSVLSAEEIEAFPYTVQYARLGSRGQATIVLGYIDPVGSGYEYHWVSADQETLVTENGRGEAREPHGRLPYSGNLLRQCRPHWRDGAQWRW